MALSSSPGPALNLISVRGKGGGRKTRLRYNATGEATVVKRASEIRLSETAIRAFDGDKRPDRQSGRPSPSGSVGTN